METHMNYGDYFRTPVYVWFVTVSIVLILLIRWFMYWLAMIYTSLDPVLEHFRGQREKHGRRAPSTTHFFITGTVTQLDRRLLWSNLSHSISRLGGVGWYVLLSVYVTLNCHNRKRLDKIVFVILVRILLARCCLNMYFARDSWYKHKTTFGLCGKFRSLNCWAMHKDILAHNPADFVIWICPTDHRWLY